MRIFIVQNSDQVNLLKIRGAILFQHLNFTTAYLLPRQVSQVRGAMASRYRPWGSQLDLLFHPSRTSPSQRRGQSGCPSLLLFPTALLDWNTSHRYLHPSSFPRKQIFTWEAACIREKELKKASGFVAAAWVAAFELLSEAFCNVIDACLSVEVPVRAAALHGVLSCQVRC